MANSWWEIQVVCDTTLEEAMFWRLEQFGCKGSSSERKGDTAKMLAYYPQAQAHVLDLAALSLSIRQDALTMQQPVPAVRWGLIEEEDWSQTWKAQWEPREIGDHFLIHPAWLPVPQTDRKILTLEPGVAFGTGEHATTQLCLEALEMRLEAQPEEIVIADFGCGSGVLSVGALLLGAKQLYAVDTDPLATNATLENIIRNQLDPAKLLVATGSVEALLPMVPEPVDGIVCNILADIIVDLIPQWTPIVKPETWGILSGILLDQAKGVADVLEGNGWFVAALWKRGDWTCMNIRRL
ncbi:50S ribosomal protein L11 methyltransferase [filamentous cyanobacterium LEGE 11480]|uniref:Ribosomal protein L11 methyltransferase n=1 Tax=Romeriopsis navalis LEGE 11480 TaxID=2777977 RepID=A0A928VT64_9CYAN|nr:50S ribosomal protein L11 methyltransferase [Romeriopsis navalis]MBE9031629.1 50S ribosomal protein L11 methyltransferase [Romeriopsis navalis LEGE 11480]